MHNQWKTYFLVVIKVVLNVRHWCHLFNHHFAATGKCGQKALEPMPADLDPSVSEHHCQSALLVQAISSTIAPTHIAELALKTKKISSKSGQDSVVERSGHRTAGHVCSVHSKTEILSDIRGSHRDDYEDHCLMGFDAVQSGGHSQIFQSDIPFPSSG